MPFLFLSPSTQTYNPYLTTGSEQYWMNRLADRMLPYLAAGGITVTRNNENGSAAQSIRDSNAGKNDFHLALHSNAAPAGSEGKFRGVDVYYFPTSEDGLRMANLIVENLKPVYPLPERVRALPTTAIGEVRRTNAPSVLAELGYHDNAEDEAWLTGNLDAIARALSKSVAEYFALPFLEPQPVRTAAVTLENGVLNLRGAPSLDAPVLAQIPNGTRIETFAAYDGWYTADFDGIYGYVRGEFLTF